jgi:hypothetical protein
MAKSKKRKTILQNKSEMNNEPYKNYVDSATNDNILLSGLIFNYKISNILNYNILRNKAISQSNTIINQSEDLMGSSGSSNRVKWFLDKLVNFNNNYVIADDDYYKKYFKRFKAKRHLSRQMVINDLNTDIFNQPSIKELSEQYGVSYTTMINFVKKDLHYRFKVTSNLNIQGNSHELSLNFVYFADTLTTLILNDNMLIYIDESQYNTNKSTRRKWIGKSENNIVYIPNKISNTNLLLACCKNEIIYYELLYRTNNQMTFCNFLNNLLNQIKNNEKYNTLYEQSKLVFVMDNSRIHSTKLVLGFFIVNRVKLLFITKYSPYLNQAEYIFSYLKRQFYRQFFYTK